MQTLRKLPITAPNTAAAPTMMPVGTPSNTTRDLVKKDSRRHGHIERFHPGSELDRHPPVRRRRQSGADAGALVAQDQRDRATGPAARFPQRLAVGGRDPVFDPGRLRPGEIARGIGGDRGEPEQRAHAAAQHLGVLQVRRALEGDDARPAEAERGPQDGAHVAGILHRVQDQNRPAGGGREVLQPPFPRLDHRDHALRLLRVGQGLELGVAHDLQPYAGALQRALERRAARSTFQPGRHGHAADRDPRRQRLFHQPHALGQRQSAALAGAPAMEIANGGQQGAGHGYAQQMKIALTIAGSDSGGGAGIQADLKTFQQFGVFGTSVIVALTAQNTVGVRAVEPVSEAMVGEQLTALAEDLPPDALKTGMLADVALVRLVAKAVRENGWTPLVVDPVMVSTSGHRLLTAEAEEVIRESLLPLAAVVTPNLDEAAILTGRAVHD